MVGACRPRGFTLIELLVTISLMVLLVLIAVPLTAGWVNAAHVRQAHYRLLEAIGRAKAVALRNERQAADAAPAATLVLAGSTLCVFVAVPDAVSCGSGSVWTATVDAGVRLDGQTTQCIALDNRALPANAAIGGVNCGAGNYSISRGSERYPDEGTLSLY